MENKDKPAYGLGFETQDNNGLSKLEYAAIHFMAANNPTIGANPEKHYAEWAKRSVESAKALFIELDKQQ